MKEAHWQPHEVANDKRNALKTMNTGHKLQSKSCRGHLVGA